MASTEASRKDNNFNVTVTKQEVVAAMLPLQEHWLPLSNLDLILPPVDVGVFFCYDKPPTTATSSVVVEALRKSLSEALVSFYAFAGELVANSAGEPELLCNNRGVEFVEAVADVELRSLDLYSPDDSIEGKLVAKKKHGVLAVQATFLKCGGLVVACSFDHRIADAYSANMFLVSWSKLAQPTRPTTTTPPSLPCFRRSLLRPRRPRYIHPSIHDMYVPFSNLPPPKKPRPGSESDPLISRIYYITADQLDNIQSLANSNAAINGVKKRTKIESFSAFLWKMVAATAKDKRVIAKMGIVVDGRERLSKKLGSLLSSYFGNVVSIPYGAKTAGYLSEKSLSWVADEVHEFLKAATTEEHFLGLIDWVEEHRPGAGLARIYCGGHGDGGEGEEDDGPAIVVSSGQRFVGSKVDFGWGRPVFWSYHFTWGGDAGYVMPMPNPAENGDWVVYMHLRRGQLKKIECEAANVFKPLTWDYLN